MSELTVSLNEATNLCYTFEFVLSQRDFLLRENHQKNKNKSQIFANMLNTYVVPGIKQPHQMLQASHNCTLTKNPTAPGQNRRSIIHSRVGTLSAADSQGTCNSDLTADKKNQSGNQAIFLIPSQTLEADQHFLAPFRHMHICFTIYASRTADGDSEFLLASSIITIFLAGIKQTGGSPYPPPHHGSSNLYCKHLNAEVYWQSHQSEGWSYRSGIREDSRQRELYEPQTTPKSVGCQPPAAQLVYLPLK